MICRRHLRFLPARGEQTYALEKARDLQRFVRPDLMTVQSEGVGVIVVEGDRGLGPEAIESETQAANGRQIQPSIVAAALAPVLHQRDVGMSVGTNHT